MDENVSLMRVRLQREYITSDEHTRRILTDKTAFSFELGMVEVSLEYSTTGIQTDTLTDLRSRMDFTTAQRYFLSGHGQCCERIPNPEI